MAQNFFITGAPKAGKTTLLRKVIAALRKRGLRVCGFISPEEKHHGTRTGFYVEDIVTMKLGRLADVNADGPKVSKYHVDIKAFEGVALPVMKGFGKYDVIIIDEIGRMELKSRKFLDALDRILDSKTPLIASLHQDYIEEYGAIGHVIYLTDTNREAVYNDLLDRVETAMQEEKEAEKAEVAAALERRKKEKPSVKKVAAKKAEEKRKAKRGEKQEQPKKKAERKVEPPSKEKRGVFHHMRDLIGF